MKCTFHPLFAVLVALLFSYKADAQTITRFAGYDTSSAGGYGGDGGPAVATAVKMNQPSALTVDAAGNVYIAEGNGNRIRMVTTTGIIYTICGDGTAAFLGEDILATAAEVNIPRGLTIDPAGNLVIADGNNSRIRKIDHTTGMITTIAGTGTPGYTGDGGAASAATFNIPFDVKYDAKGNLYVCDWFNNAVRKISTTDSITTIAGTGAPGYSGDGGAATAATLHFPRRTAMDAAGNLFVVDGNNNSIRKIDMTTGKISTVAGSPTGAYGNTGDGGPATAALLNSPTSMQFDVAGNMYIADYASARIRRVSAATGIINTVVGTAGLEFETGDGGPATAATIDKPYDIVFDAANNLYIADLGGHTVRKVSPSPALGTHQYNTLNNEVVLSPNPNKGTFGIRGYLSALSDQSVALSVTNMLGQVVYSGNTTAHNGFIAEQVTIGTNSGSGLYLLHLTSGSETNIVRFMIDK